MKNKRTMCIVLALVMLMSLGACGAAPSSSAPQATDAPKAADEAAAEATPAPAPLSDTDVQLALIQSKLKDMLQKDGDQPWVYTVTDLDHNGNLEFVAAKQHTKDRSENLKIWEVNADRKALTQARVVLEEDETFPDFMTDSTDTYHVTSSDTWSYMFYDNVVISDSEVYTRKSAMTYKNGEVSYEPYAIEHTVVSDGMRNISYLNADGDDITQQDYNASGLTAFVGAERSNTGFEWLKADEAKELYRLGNSWMVFAGLRKAPETLPFPLPDALQPPAVTPGPAPTASPAPTDAPAPTPVPPPAPTYLTITKNPTNEPGKREGDTALFVAGANVFDSLYWTLVSPSGAEYTPDQFARRFPSVSISGYYGTTLSIANLIIDVGGWGAYCTFYYGGQSARTSTAYVYVKYTPPTPKSGSVDGSVTDWNYGYVSVWGNDGRSVAIDWNLVSLSGDIYNGAPATYYWSGNKDNITSCYITGKETPVGPVYGSMSGSAHEGGGGYAIDLDNGTQVFVDSWNCKVEGQFYDGCSAVVYYMNYPSTENVYHADIYGNQGLIIPTNDEDQGGWAGSHYYDSMPYTGFQAADPYNDQGTYGYETDNSVPVAVGTSVVAAPTHVSYNADGSTYEAIWCPDCGAEVSLARESCPVCGRGF